MKSFTPLWREAHVQVKVLKALRAWTFFGGSHVLHSIPLRYITTTGTIAITTTLRSITLRYIQLLYITLHCTAQHHIELLHYHTPNSAALHLIYISTFSYSCNYNCDCLQVQLQLQVQPRTQAKLKLQLS